MAAQAVVAELIQVRIAMAVRAVEAQAKKSPAQVLDLDFGLIGGHDVAWIVAGRAGQLAMLAFQGESCEAGVVELLAVELGDLELPAVVLRDGIARSPPAIRMLCRPDA